jgi:iron(III) transport system substrate-binding protein
MIRNLIVALSVLLWVGMVGSLAPARAQGNDSQNWGAIVEAAKAEGKVVVSIPTSAKLRKDFEAAFESQFPGIELELDVGRGSSNIRKILSENNAGVHSVDLHIGGTTSIITGLLAADLLQPVMPAIVLPDVKDAEQWWGGHMWIDNAKKYVYSFTGYMTETVWYNSDLVKPEEINSYDSLLEPKWKGKIVILDPRTPGSGESTWAFLWRIKGEEYLQKLVAQEMTVGRNLRQLGETVARGKSALSIGVSYYTYLPFIKAGLPVKPITDIREGFYASSGSGNVVLLKHVPHPNAAKVFLNWLLSKNGQAVFTKALGQPTRRLDVDTQWTKEFGHAAAKDTLTPARYDELENGSENVIMQVRNPARKFAKKLLD